MTITAAAPPASVRPSELVSAPAPDELARRTALWITVLVSVVILLQRFAIPGQPVGLVLVVALIWLGLAARRGLVELDPRRLALWCAAVAATGLVMLAQVVVLPQPVISVNSWLLFSIVWLPCVVRMRDRRLSTYRLTLVHVVRVHVVLAGACIVMMLSQLAGLRYDDWLARLVPGNLLLSHFAITYPLTFGSPIYKSNAWIGLEPSIVSYELGIGLLAAILVRAAWWQVLVLLVGLATAASGSGFVVLLAGLLVILVSSGRRVLVRFSLPAALVGVVVALTPLGQTLLGRTSEVGTTGSSASLRSILPYQELAPTWVSDFAGALLGHGSGSSQRIVQDGGIAGLLVPTPAKVFYDYGLVAGLVLAAFLVFCYFEGPSMALAFSLFFSVWAIQPGNQPIIALPVMFLVTWWAPRHERRIEDELMREAVRHRWVRRPALVR